MIIYKSLCFFLFITLPLLAFRDPFQFKTQKKKVEQCNTNQKWKIKKIEETCIVMENIHDGTKRTIELKKIN